MTNAIRAYVTLLFGGIGLKRAVTRNFFHKSLISFGLVFLLLTVLLSMCYLGVFDTHIKTQISRSSMELLERVAGAGASQHTQIDYINYLILRDRQTTNFLLATKEDKIVNYQSLLGLLKLRTFYQNLDNIALMNFRTGVCVNVRGNQNEIAFVKDALRGEASRTVFRKRSVYQGMDDYAQEVASFIQYLPAYDSAILIDVPLSSINPTLNDAAPIGNAEDQIYFLDDHGTVVSVKSGILYDEEAEMIRESLLSIIDLKDHTAKEYTYEDTDHHRIFYINKSDTVDWCNW